MTLRKWTLLSALLALAALSTTPAAAQISIGYPGPYGRGPYDLSASVRLEVSPKTTEVYVDGYYAGKVDEFDGAFQRLRAEPGEHEIELYLPGYRLHSQKVYLQPGNTFKVRHTMAPLAAGEPEPVKPQAAPRPRPPAGAGGPQGTRDRPLRDQAGRDQPGADQPGAVTIRVQPGDASILIDGQRWDGNGDERVTVQLAPGSHTIEVRKPGYRGYLTEVRVEPGRTLPVNIALAPE